VANWLAFYWLVTTFGPWHRQQQRNAEPALATGTISGLPNQSQLFPLPAYSRAHPAHALRLELQIPANMLVPAARTRS